MTRDEARTYTRAAVETFYKHFGPYVETPGQGVIVQQLGVHIGNTVSDATFEEALRIHERIDRLNDNTHSLHINGYGYDIHPSDPDYHQAKAHHIESAEQELTAAISNIVGIPDRGCT